MTFLRRTRTLPGNAHRQPATQPPPLAQPPLSDHPSEPHLAGDSQFPPCPCPAKENDARNAASGVPGAGPTRGPSSSPGRAFPRRSSGLGPCTLSGDGVPYDAEESVKWMRAAAEQGDPGAQSGLADAYYEGAGVGLDLEQAARWYRAAANGGDEDASVMLGMMYADCDVDMDDDPDAERWLRVAADAGHDPARYLLGELGVAGYPTIDDDDETPGSYRAAPEQDAELARAEDTRRGPRIDGDRAGRDPGRGPRDDRQGSSGGVAGRSGRAVHRRDGLPRGAGAAEGRCRGVPVVSGGGQAGRSGLPEQRRPDVSLRGGRGGAGPRRGAEVVPHGGQSGATRRPSQPCRNVRPGRGGARGRPGEGREAESCGRGAGSGGRAVQPRRSLFQRERAWKPTGPRRPDGFGLPRTRATRTRRTTSPSRTPMARASTRTMWKRQSGSARRPPEGRQAPHTTSGSCTWMEKATWRTIRTG